MKWQSWSKLPTKRLAFRPKTASFFGSTPVAWSEDLCTCRRLELLQSVDPSVWNPSDPCAFNIKYSKCSIFSILNQAESLPIFSTRGDWGISARAWALGFFANWKTATLHQFTEAFQGFAGASRLVAILRYLGTCVLKTRNDEKSGRVEEWKSGSFFVFWHTDREVSQGIAE